MIKIDLELAQAKAPELTDAELAQACSEATRLSKDSRADVNAALDLMSILGREVIKRGL